MEPLTNFVLLRMATAPRFVNAKAVDPDYQARDPGNPRTIRFGSMAAVIGAIFLVAILAPL